MKISLGASLPGDKEVLICTKGSSRNSRWNKSGVDNARHRAVSLQQHRVLVYTEHELYRKSSSMHTALRKGWFDQYM